VWQGKNRFLRESIFAIGTSESVRRWLTRWYQSRESLGWREAMELDHFVSGSMTADQLHRISSTVQSFREKTNQSFIRGGIDWWGRHFDAQLIPERLTDLVGGRSRKDF
jgi:hypothetical protein